MRLLSFSLSLLLFALVSCIIVSFYFANNILGKNDNGPEQIVITSISTYDADVHMQTEMLAILTAKKSKYMQNWIFDSKNDQLSGGHSVVEVHSSDNKSVHSSRSIISISGTTATSHCNIKLFNKVRTHIQHFYRNNNEHLLNQFLIAKHYNGYVRNDAYSLSNVCVEMQ
jgi:hypothetical protein